MSAQLAMLDEADSRMGPDSSEILSAVLGVFQDKGFERGYGRALHDVLASLVPLTEQYLNRPSEPSGEARRLIYGYIAFLENHIQQRSEEAGYVSGGLGI